MTTKLRPLEDRVVIKPVDPAKRTAAGLYLSDQALEQPTRGRIIAAGPGKRLRNTRRHPMVVKVGDSVLYGKFAGTEVHVDGVKHIILRESELLGMISA